MFVKMLSIAAGPSRSHDVGHIVEVDEETGKAWIAGGHAEKCAAPAAVETASVDEGSKAIGDTPLINKLRGGNAKPKEPKE